MARNYDPNHPAFSQALTDLRTELAELPGDNLETIRHDIVSAIVLCLGVAPEVRVFRDPALALFGAASAQNIDRLEIAARACGRAHAAHLTTLHGTEVTDMVEQLSQKRSVLLLEAQALVSQAHLPGSVLAELVGGTAYKGICLDVLQLVSALRAEWAAVEAHTPVTPLELDQAEALANALVTTLGENERADSSSSPSADLRRRAYTLLVRTYDEVRRLVTYFRWDEGDADEIAPSLSAGRTARKRDEEVAVELVPVAPTNGAAPVRAGMPGAPPFMAS